MTSNTHHAHSPSILEPGRKSLGSSGTSSQPYPTATGEPLPSIQSGPTHRERRARERLANYQKAKKKAKSALRSQKRLAAKHGSANSELYQVEDFDAQGLSFSASGWRGRLEKTTKTNVIIPMLKERRFQELFSDFTLIPFHLGDT